LQRKAAHNLPARVCFRYKSLISLHFCAIENPPTGAQSNVQVFDENWHSSTIQRDPGDVQLRQHVHDTVDGQQAPARGSLRGVPPLLHRQAEDR
jgi:hypothetical protein